MSTFQKQDRLLTPTEFKRVFERKCSVSNSWLVLYASLNERGRTRIGLSVSRKVGNAVVRNRFKRLYREAFRLTRADLPEGLDLILIPRSSRQATLEDIQESLRALAPSAAQRLARSEKP